MQAHSELCHEILNANGTRLPTPHVVGMDCALPRCWSAGERGKEPCLANCAGASVIRLSERVGEEPHGLSRRGGEITTAA